MGIKRIVDTSFWTDGKVDDFSPEDKYFMLYLLTNPFSTQLGIYEISIKQVAFQMGYYMDAVKVLIDRFENKYGMILFSTETNEIAIKNFLRHSIIKGGAPVRDCLIKEIKRVKNKDLIARVAKESGLSENLFDEMNEKPTSSLLYSLVMGVQSSKGLYYHYNDMLNGDNLFRIQADLIKQIANEGPCIIVGRCADYILRENPNLIKIFLYADTKERVKNLMARDNMTEKEAQGAVNKADKRRANYYNFYTNNTWGHVNNYNICLDTAALPIEVCVELLYNYIKGKEKKFL